MPRTWLQTVVTRTPELHLSDTQYGGHVGAALETDGDRHGLDR
jgi:hypothetical protein